MTTTGLQILDQAVAEANRWIQEITEDLRLPDRHRAYSCLRAVLHAIRDHLRLQDALGLARSLPPAVRGFYVDGWVRSQGPPKESSREAFLAKAAERLIEVPELQPDQAAIAVFALLSRRIDEGEMPNFRTVWPEPLAAFWPGGQLDAPPGAALSPEKSQARVEKTKEEIRAAIEGARREGAPEEELPTLTSRKRKGPSGRRRSSGPRGEEAKS